MNLKNSLALLLLISMISCTDTDNFKISNNAVGPIQKTTTPTQLKAMFWEDSLVATKSGYILYEKGGNKLMKLLPKTNTKDAIDHIQFFDDRYTTAEGISLQSTFKDIINAYTIKRIDNLIGAIVVFVEESDAYFTIDKKHLPADLMFDTRVKIDKVQIPDDAPIKFLMFGWSYE